MGATFAEKFEEALAERRQREPEFGLRTVARRIADGDPEKTKTILRRLQKYRPKPGRGGAGEVAPTPPTRREIERAMDLPEDSLAPDLAGVLAARAAEAAKADAFDRIRSLLLETAA